MICSKEIANCDIFLENLGGDISDWEYELTKVAFERQIKSFTDKFVPLLEETLEFANKSKEEVDKVLLVGGSVHIP